MKREDVSPSMVITEILGSKELSNNMKQEIIQGDCLEKLKDIPAESIDCMITSPPYWALRDYGITGQLGLEPTFQEYVTKLCDIFDEVKRVLKKDGTCWVNMGDTYAMTSVRGGNKPFGAGVGANKHYEKGSIPFKREKQTVKNKSLCQIPSRFAIEMTNRGWILRNEIIWYKPNCMPSPIKDRFTVDFEKVFFFVKSKKYKFEMQKEPLKSKFHGKDWETRKSLGEPMRQGLGKRATTFGGSPDGRNKRCVWEINTKPLKEAHFATYPEKLIEPMIKAGCPVGGVVLDPFFGAGTTGLVAKKQSKNYIGIELNIAYIEIARKRLL